MVWRRFLLALLIGTPTLVALGGACTVGDDAITGCNDGTGVTISGTNTTPGSGGSNPGSGGGGTGSGGPPVVWKCMEATCDDGTPPTIVTVDPITISDIATFHPTPGTDHMQPDGWTVPGLNTNFYAVTSVHIVNGTLLGQPASVRFTPVSFHWDYGDGKTATHGTKGDTWKHQHLHEFDRTPTSHVYAKDGRYTIRLVIDFAAEYRFAGSPFYPIDGVIPLRANDLHIVADGAKTVLVQHDCDANPGGPGC